MRKIYDLVSFLDRRLSSAGTYAASNPKFRLSIPSTIAKFPGTIPLLFYGPKTFSQKRLVDPLHTSARFPIVINFHGGGFTIGGPNNDARWATAVAETGSVFISVDYRLAPEYPHPIGIEDGVDVILWVMAHGEAYGLDPSKIVLSGASAGGNLSFTATLRLFEELKKKGGLLSNISEKLAGIVAFYPPTNWTQTREERRLSNKTPDRPAKQQVQDFLFRLFDDSYLYPRDRLSMSSKYLSPGLAPSEILREAFPDKVAIFTCGLDPLHAEGEEFRQRLIGLGKQVGGRVIDGVDHAWDKLPTFRRQNPKRDEMYAEAAALLLEMFDKT